MDPAIEADTRGTAGADEVRCRELRTQEEFQRCVEIQKETWGREFTGVVPPSFLAVVQKAGGLLIGAFLDGAMVGFVFALAGLRDGRPVQWSHMLAVVKDARGRGIGRTLKLEQRRQALERGTDTILWTFDPLQARNAHLNLNRLGVSVTEYVPDMYGGDTGSPLHEGGATDRFVVEWRLRDPRTLATLRGRPPGGSEPEIERTVAARPRDGTLPAADVVRIPIPANYLALARRDPDAARDWRLGTRRAFEHYLGRGYAVAAFRRADGGEDATGECFYVLTADGRPPSESRASSPMSASRSSSSRTSSTSRRE